MRIETKFKQIKEQRRIAFMPFLVAGDPDFKTSVEIAKTLSEHADFLEIGFPYSDPLADGPVVQAGDQRALESGMNTKKVFELVEKIREFTDIPITVLVYANLVYQYGIDVFYKEARKVGIQGILIPDVPVEEIDPFKKAARETGIDQIFLVTHTTTKERLKKILSVATGYLYLVSVLGVTGVRKDLASKTLTLIKRVKKQTSLPVSIGFGISKHSHVVALQKAHADGYIVGSAIVRIIEENRGDRKKLQRRLREYIHSLKGKKG